MASKSCKTAGKKTTKSKTKKARSKAASTLASACKLQANRKKRLLGKSVYKKKKK